MKNISKLLVACLLQGAAFAVTYDQKTFLLPHNPVHTQLLEQALFRTHRNTAGHEQGGHIQATGFYGTSMNRAAVGQYFGIGNGKNSFKVGSQLNAVLAVDFKTELDGGYLIHNQANSTNQAGALAGTVTLLPKQTSYGVNLTYRQAFHGFCGRRFFFQVSAPIVQVKNDLGLSITKPTNVVLGAQTYSLADFFAGKVNIAAGDINAQTGLTKGKMVNRALYAAGIADVNLQLGYSLVHNDNTHVDMYLRGLVPTGNKSTGEYLWEPLVGNNNHYAMGAGVDADVTMWHDEDKGRLSLQGSLAYNYVFESTEARMAGITRRLEPAFKYNQYVLMGKPGDTSVASAANQLVQDFRVRPGSQLELMTGFGFHSVSGVTANVGYNLNWRAAEQVYRKATDVFTDTYAIASKMAILNAMVPTDPAGGAIAPAVGLLSVSSAALPAYNVGTIFTAAKAQAAAAVDGAAMQEAVARLNAVLGAQAGSGNNAGAAAIVAAAPHANELPAYQAGAKLFAATGSDILADTAAGTVIAVANGQAAAVAGATDAKNYIANLQNANVNYADAVRQESLVTHIVGVSLGYSFTLRDGFPMMLGMGGQYELPHSSNAGIETYKVFVKAGMSF